MDSSGGQSQEMSSDSKAAERKARLPPEQAQKCPRCESSNTKFCYYNNYSQTQPRYFCKACRRYWTKGGTLRNVPVGGGCRKNRRSSSSSSSPAQPKRAGLHEPNNRHQFSGGPLLHPSYAGTLMTTNPGFTLPGPVPGGYDQNDLTLAFAQLQKSSLCAGELGGFDHQQQQQQQVSILGNDIILGMSNKAATSSTTTGSSSGFLDALRSGLIESSYYDNIGGEYYHDEHQDQVSSTTPSTPAVTLATTKQELCNSMRLLDHHHQGNSSSRMLWASFPWQMNNIGSGSDHHEIGLGTGNKADFDATWSGFASSWHGLLNTTPLT